MRCNKLMIVTFLNYCVHFSIWNAISFEFLDLVIRKLRSRHENFEVMKTPFSTDHMNKQ